MGGFWTKVDKKGDNECWNWKGVTNSRGDYGHIKFKGKVESAHRLSWILHHGQIPEELCALHKCDNGLCVNPKHLFLGTQYDNIQDRTNKDRSYRPIGELNLKSKLTIDQVKQIRLRYRNGKGLSLAKEYGVTSSSIYYIVNDKSWKNDVDKKDKCSKEPTSIAYPQKTLEDFFY